MTKTYILDTSALIFDPNTYEQFPDSNIIIPSAVLSELDKLKKLPNQAGRNARVAIKRLDEISDLGDISIGVLLPNNALVKVDTNYIDLATNPTYAGFGDPTYGDTKILACAYSNWVADPDQNVCVVTNDFNLKVQSKARGMEAIGNHADKKDLSDLFAGMQTVNDEDAGLDLQQQGYIDPRCYGLNLSPNECVLFEGPSGDGIAMGRKVTDDKVKLIKKHFPWGISARNKEQTFALDLIMDKNIDLVTLIGKAGTGKSLMVLAAALELVLSKREYEKFIIYRPIQPVGNDIGYLPGTMEEKLAPWFQAIMDNFETLFSSKNGDNWRRELEMYQKKGKIEMEAITYIRGRSIPDAIILIDECQNLTPEEVKTILTRAGEGTKIILTGDIEQIDNSVLDATSNGLTHVIEKFKDSPLAGHITFTQGERSRLATKAAEIL
jgi:PhoH-like ATPase